jgi:cellulose synthase/poly-beta-1,6-N-acetylglucosamine synthase-like glycosyltransferase
VNLVFWTALGVVAFAYAGYPAVMACLAWVRPRAVQRHDQTPGMEVLLVVHDGASQLPAKLANLLSLDYPEEKLRINVVCDGCSDASESIARSVSSDRIRVFAFAERRGKAACLGSVLPLLEADLVLFNDVRQRIDPGAAKALAAALADPGVGAASGELVLETSNAYGQGVDLYWRYEKLIRKLESASGSLVGATGAIYAARREALPPVPAGVVLDDMWIPLGIAAAGYRVVFVPEALAYDHATPKHADEERRKRRTLAGNYQLLHRWPQLAIPGAHPLALRLWGHKWLRLFVPGCLLAMLASSMVLAAGGNHWFSLLLSAQLGAYALALLGRVFPNLASQWWPIRICTAFFSLNFAAAMASIDYLRNPNAHLWQPTIDRMPAP